MNASIAILSEHPAHKNIIAQFPQLKELYDANTHDKFEVLLESHKINIVICDSSLANESILNMKSHNCIILCNENERYSSLAKNFRIIYKPIDINELFKQIRLIITEQKKLTNHIIIGSYKFDFSARTLKRASDDKISLTEKESYLLKYLFDKKSYTSKDELLANIWGYSNMSDTHTIETHIYRIRKKLDDEDIIIVDDQGVKIGY